MQLDVMLLKDTVHACMLAFSLAYVITRARMYLTVRPSARSLARPFV